MKAIIQENFQKLKLGFKDWKSSPSIWNSDGNRSTSNHVILWNFRTWWQRDPSVSFHRSWRTYVHKKFSFYFGNYSTFEDNIGNLSKNLSLISDKFGLKQAWPRPKLFKGSQGFWSSPTAYHSLLRHKQS